MAEVTRFADGFQWVDRGADTDDHLGPAPHEASLEPVLAGLLPDSGVFLDVGAHVGRWAIRLAGKASRVIAVEANPDTIPALRQNIELNGLSNIEVWECAAWDRSERLQLSDPNGKVSGGSTRCLPAPNGVVEGVRLDERLEALGRLDLVKLDVEGADIEALHGMSQTLLRLRPALFIELHHMYGYYDRADLEAVLEGFGYAWRPAPRYLDAEYIIAE